MSHTFHGEVVDPNVSPPGGHAGKHTVWEEREREGVRERHTELRACRLLLLLLTVGSAVDLLDCTHERRELFYSLCATWKFGGLKQRSVCSEVWRGKTRRGFIVGFFDSVQLGREVACFCCCWRYIVAVLVVCSELCAEKVGETSVRKRATDVFRGYAASWGMRAAARHRRPFQRFCCCGVGLVAVLWLAQVIQAPGETVI